MILVVSNQSHISERIKDSSLLGGIRVTRVPLDEARGELRGRIDLIVYDVYDLRKRDVENIHLASKRGIPVILMTAYPKKRAMDEISRLWRNGDIKGYLLKPVKMEELSAAIEKAIGNHRRGRKVYEASRGKEAL